MSGMMTASGLVDMISMWFVEISTAHTFPLYTFLSAGLVNIFIPSGGGQWAIQGPIMMKAAEALGRTFRRQLWLLLGEMAGLIRFNRFGHCRF